MIVEVTVTVTYHDDERAGELVTTQKVRHLARFLRRARALRVALAQFPDFEVVYLFDLAQDGYGYAVNVQVPPFSEWDTAPVELWQGLLGAAWRNGLSAADHAAPSTAGPVRSCSPLLATRGV